MRLLVTGGCGFIGSNLALALEERGHEVVVLDDLSTGHLRNLAGFRGQVVTADIAEPLRIDGRFDAIFHQAAITDPRYPDDQEVLASNLGGFRNVLSLALQQDAKLIYASSASLYGNGPAPQREDQAKDLLNAYAASKLIVDEMASHHWRTHHVVGLRYFNVFGPRESAKGRAASMIFHLTRQIAAGKRPRIFTDGSQRRDHVYVKDCVLANIAALDAEPGVYNVGTGIATSFTELVAQLNGAMGADLPPDYIENPYGETYQCHTQASTERAERYLRYRPRYSLRSGIEDYLPWLRAQHPDWFLSESGTRPAIAVDAPLECEETTPSITTANPTGLGTGIGRTGEGGLVTA